MARVIMLPAGYLLDLLIGDPRWLYHPVILIGKLIAFLEKLLRKIFPKTERGELLAGFVEVLLVCAVSFLVPSGVLFLLHRYLRPAGYLLGAFWCGQLLAANSLKTESMKVYHALREGTIEDARYAISMIVGRDTNALTEEGIIKAAVETVAENTSDGVIAPMFYMALLGVPGMFLYKAVNTMDSMLGYKNDRYLFFGRCAAKLDDAANFIPARLSGILMILGSGLCGLNMKKAFQIFRRDRRKHASPNSAQTESVMAGALGAALAGNAVYFGKLYEKPVIGDPDRPIGPEDIKSANKLMYVTAFLGVLLCTGISLGLTAALL